MTVYELIQELAKQPAGADVVVYIDGVPYVPTGFGIEGREVLNDDGTYDIDTDTFKIHCTKATPEQVGLVSFAPNPDNN